IPPCCCWATDGFQRQESAPAYGSWRRQCSRFAGPTGIESCVPALLPSQRLQPVLRPDQLALLGRLALAHPQEVLSVGSERAGMDRTGAGELRHIEERALLAQREAGTRRDLGRHHLVPAVDIEEAPPVLRPGGLGASRGGDLPFGRGGRGKRADIDL